MKLKKKVPLPRLPWPDDPPSRGVDVIEIVGVTLLLVAIALLFYAFH
jgi:hypothetical protein